MKLLGAINRHLMNLNPADRIRYAAKLLPMSRVLVMLVSVYEREDHREALRSLACAILRVYCNVPFGQSEYVDQVVVNALSILEHIVLRCGNLTFSAAANTYIGLPNDIVGLRNLLNVLFNDAVFRASMQAIIRQLPNCSIHTVGQVCSLLRCLLQVDLLCSGAAGEEVERIFIFTLLDWALPDLVRLLVREIQALPVGDFERIPAALHRLCCVMGILRSVLSPPVNLIQNRNAAVDIDLAGSLTALVQWVEHLGVDHLAACMESQRLLQVLVDESVRMLHGALEQHWPRSIDAQRNLLAAVQPLGLGAVVDILQTRTRTYREALVCSSPYILYAQNATEICFFLISSFDSDATQRETIRLQVVAA